MFTKDICPVCLLLAQTCPSTEETTVILCESCGEFTMSLSAERCIECHPGPLDRRRLSETIFDVCRMVQPDRPLIDATAASSLIAISDL